MYRCGSQRIGFLLAGLPDRVLHESESNLFESNLFESSLFKSKLLESKYREIRGFYMSSDLFDALTVALVVTIFSCLLTPTLVWLFTAHQQG
jgi:hypothetical protein